MKKILWILVIMLFTMRPSLAVQIDTNRTYGVTIDAINNLSSIVTSLSSMCKKPTTRIVFDEFVAASNYQTAVNQIHNVSFIMGEILDSYYMNQYTLSTYAARVNEYLNLLGNQVDIWEIGNEVNGEWLGTISDVVAKLDTAYKIVKAQNKKTALTLYYNKVCYEKSVNEMFYWVNKNVKPAWRTGLDYVWISYYEDDCNNHQPDWQKVFDSLHVLFPNSKIGIGECGTLTASKKASFINRYYKMNITTPKYVGGYFWWYYKQDCVPYTNALWTTLNSSIANVAQPTVQASQITYCNLTSTSVTLGWTSGNGGNRAVFVKDGTTGTPTILDGISYTANSTFGLGTHDGTGFYCVYNGAAMMAPSINITGLIPNHYYRIMVIEYNGNPGFQGYNENSSTNNPINIQGIMPVELISFSSIVEKNNVKLKWITATEINNQGFSIERTIVNNIEDWETAGYVTGSGNTNSPVTYNFTDKYLAVGNYKYRLKQTDYNGNFEYHYLQGEVTVKAPTKFEMSQNYPNPFNPDTKINFSLPEKGFVTLKIYDNLGREITTLINESKTEGSYSVDFNAGNLTSGVYYYKLNAGNFTDTKRMLLVK